MADDERYTPLEEHREITMDEVAKHDSHDDCWLVLHGVVLKVDEKILDEHPGGPEVVQAVAGKDATTDFEDIGHSDSAREWSDKAIIGWLPGHEGKRDVIPRLRDLKASSSKNSSGSSFQLLPLLAAGVALAAAVYALK